MFVKNLILSGLFAASAYANCLYGTSFDKRQEETVKVSEFGYTALQGPLNWAGLKPENKPCARGKFQSPINIDSGISRNTQRLAINFPSVGSAKLENLGTTLEVPVTGSTTIAGVQYNLKQFHFHTPSEHRIFEEYYPLEMHLVHEATDGSKRIAVLAVTFQLSQSTTELLTQVFKNIGNARKPGSVATTGPLNFGPLVNHLSTTPLFRYNGSLTTPPCAETVTFFITEKPLLLNIQTFNAVKSVIKFNSRYTQNKLGAENLLNRNGGLPAGH